MSGLFFLGAFVAEIIGTIAGFGSSTVFLPIALVFFDFKTALTLVAFFHLFGNLTRIVYFHKGMDMKVFLLFGIPSVIATFIGAYLVNYVPHEILKGLLGIFLIAYALWALTDHYLKIKNRIRSMIIGGAVSGFIAGLIGTGGAVRGAMLNALVKNKNKYIVTTAAVAFIVDLTRIPIYIAQGYLRENMMWYLLVLFVISLIGSYLGKIIVERVPQREFRVIVLLAVLAAGGHFVYQWIMG